MDNNFVTPIKSIDSITVEIKTLTEQAQAQALNYAIEIGKRLTEAKSMLNHGEWEDWLKGSVNYSQSTANNFMKLYKEYGKENVLANSQTVGNLSYTKALALLAIPAEERESFAEEVGASELSKRELEKAIKERNEALKRASEAEEKIKEMDKLQSEADCARLEAQNSEAAVNDLKKEMNKLLEKLDKAKKAAKESEERIKSLETNPNIPDDVLNKIREEELAKAMSLNQEKLTKAVKESEDRIAKILAKQKELEQYAAENERKAEDLRKQLATASPDVIEFKTMFTDLQNRMEDIHKVLTRIESSDADLATKLKTALNAFVKKYESSC